MCLSVPWPICTHIHHPRQRQIDPLRVVICRGKNRYVDELHLRDPGHNPTSSELLLERSVAKESELCSTEMEQSSVEETHATQLKCTIQKKLFLLKKGSGMTFLPASFSKETLQAEISKLVTRLVRRYDQDERETDGAVHWKSMGPKLLKAFQKAGGQKFSDTDWLQHVYERSNKMRFQYCMTSVNFLLYIRAIQGHTGGNLIAPELMGHVAIPYKWKEILFHRGCSFDVASVLKSGLIAGGKESKEGRQTIFFTPLNPFGDNPDEEEPCDDLSKPRKVHCYSTWKNTQDAVHWINLARAQDKGLRFWKTRSHAVIAHSSQSSVRDDASSHAEDCTQECLAIAAATTAAARHI